MQDKMTEKMDREIRGIQAALGSIGPMRPGAVSRQYHKPREKEGGFWQLSYTYRQRSHTENVREGELEAVRAEIEEYRRFKELCARWVELALARARRNRDLRRQRSAESKGNA